MSIDLATSEKVALNADVVGYSRLLADDLSRTTTRMEELRHLVTSELQEVDAVLVDFSGDNFMALFDDPRSAVKTAIAISSRLEDENVDLGPEQQLQLRIGIDSGDVGEVDGKFFGDPLNIASRIQVVAPAGGLSVSERVYRLLDEPELRFHPRGPQTFKNIPEQVAVYEFKDLPRDPSKGKRHDSLALGSPTVAVLPIHTENVDHDVAAQASIVRSDLIHRLSQVAQLVVVDTGPDKERPGHPARYVIESGVHVFGTTARVYVEVIEVATWNIVKVFKRTAEVTDIVGISEELADDVARSIEVDLVIGAPASLYSELDDPAAIESIYRGWHSLMSGTKEGWDRALQSFASVAASHPNQPYGHVLMAFTNWWGAANGVTDDVENTMTAAYEQAGAGKSAGDPTGMADMVMAAVLMSRREYDRAIEMVTNTQFTRSTCDASFGLQGSIRRFMGDWEQAIEAEDTAMRLTAVNKPWYPTVKACSLLLGGRADEAMSMAEQVLEHQPSNLEALLTLAASQVELGLDRRAQATAKVVRERFPGVDIGKWLDDNPYRDPRIVAGWKGRLSEVGLVQPEA